MTSAPTRKSKVHQEVLRNPSHEAFAMEVMHMPSNRVQSVATPLSKRFQKKRDVRWIVIALVLAAALAWGVNGLAAEQEPPGELKAGFSQVDITPPAGAIITGPSAP